MASRSTSHFLELPVELRSMIYSYALKDVQLRLRAEGQKERLPGMRPVCAEIQGVAPVALLMTCKQVRDEATQTAERDMSLNVTYNAVIPYVGFSNSGPHKTQIIRDQWGVPEACEWSLLPRPIQQCVVVPQAVTNRIRQARLTFVDSMGTMHIRDGAIGHDATRRKPHQYQAITIDDYHDHLDFADKNAILGIPALVQTLPKLVTLDLRIVLNLANMQDDIQDSWGAVYADNSLNPLPPAESYFTIPEAYQPQKSSQVDPQQASDRIAPRITTSMVLAGPSYEVYDEGLFPNPTIQNEWTRHESFVWQTFRDDLVGPMQNRIFYSASPATAAEIDAGHHYRGLTLSLLTETRPWTEAVARAEQQRDKDLALNRDARVNYVQDSILYRLVTSAASEPTPDQLSLFREMAVDQADEVDQGDWGPDLGVKMQRDMPPCLCCTHGVMGRYSHGYRGNAFEKIFKQ